MIACAAAGRPITRGLPVLRPALCAAGGSTSRPFRRSTCAHRRPVISPRRAPVSAMTRIASATGRRMRFSFSSCRAPRTGGSRRRGRRGCVAAAVAAGVDVLGRIALIRPSRTAQARTPSKSRIACRAVPSPPVTRARARKPSSRRPPSCRPGSPRAPARLLAGQRLDAPAEQRTQVPPDAALVGRARRWRFGREGLAGEIGVEQVGDGRGLPLRLPLAERVAALGDVSAHPSALSRAWSAVTACRACRSWRAAGGPPGCGTGRRSLGPRGQDEQAKALDLGVPDVKRRPGSACAASTTRLVIFGMQAPRVSTMSAPDRKSG